MRDATCVEYFDPAGKAGTWEQKNSDCLAGGGYLPIPRTTTEVANVIAAVGTLIQKGML